HGKEIDRATQLIAAQISRVGFFQQLDLRMTSQLGVDLAIVGIDNDHVRGSALQHAIGESPGGGANVQALPSGEINPPVLQCRLEFEPAAADVSKILP